MAYEHWPHTSFDMLRLYRFFSGGRPARGRNAAAPRPNSVTNSRAVAVGTRVASRPPHRTARKIVNLSDNLAVGVDYGLTVIGSSNGAQQFAEFIYVIGGPSEF